MSIFKHLTRQAPAEADGPGLGQGGAGGGQLPIADYDKLAEKKVIEQLGQLSQHDLAAVEAHERSHQEREAILNKLRYLRGSEPLPGYDGLDSAAVVEALASADSATIKAARDYERKFQRRQVVIDEITRLLLTSTATAGEDRAREEKLERVREGFAGRDKAAGRVADSRSNADGAADEG